MELLPGETVADTIARGAVEPDWVRRVAGDVLQALAAAHAAGIVHRDIKPANILLASDGCAKVTDFGIAKTLEVAAGDAEADLTSTNQLLGTPAYLAPERIDGAPATPRSDLYSLGVVLYEALAGQKPFTGPTPIAIADAVQRSTPTPLTQLRPDVDPAFAAVIDQAMARDPSARYASAADMVSALDGASTSGELPQVIAATGGADATQTLHVDATQAVTAAAPAGRAEPEPVRAAAAPITRARPARRGMSLWPVLIVAGLLLLGLGVAMAIGAPGDDERLVEAGTDPAAEQQSANPVVAELLSVADSLDVGDGEAGRSVAGRLREVAAAVEAGGGGEEATALMRDVATLRAERQLGVTATQIALDALRKVPGSDASVIDEAAAAAEAGSEDDEGEGKGAKGKKGRDGDDDD
jgi:hypothetical protein